MEAKAHDAELSAAGKSQPTTPNGERNHRRIGAAIAEANAGLSRAVAGWALSRDTHYQLSNRFAWAWKLASLGVPVILVYLGFLGVREMADQGRPFAGAADWEHCLMDQAAGVVPAAPWGPRARRARHAVRRSAARCTTAATRCRRPCLKSLFPPDNWGILGASRSLPRHALNPALMS